MRNFTAFFALSDLCQIKFQTKDSDLQILRVPKNSRLTVRIGKLFTIHDMQIGYRILRTCRN